MKKLISILFAAMLVMAAILPLTAFAAEGTNESGTQAENKQKYISEICLVAVPRTDGNTINDAYDKLTEQGYEYHLDFDFNKHSGGDYVALGYKRTDNADEAITNLVTRYYTTSSYDESFNMEFDQRVYTIVNGDANFNNGAENGNYYIRLYYTKDKREGPPVCELYAYDAYSSNIRDKMLINSPDNPSYAALDYENWEEGCDSGTRLYSYLYRGYDKEIYGDYISYSDMSDNVLAEGGQNTGSVFNNNPVLIVIISLILGIMLGSAATAIILKKKAKTKEN